jgi:FkbM family methyltransferase
MVNKYQENTRPENQIFLFEANSFHNRSLKQTKNPYFNVILSDTTKKIEFYSNNSTGDSYYKEIGEFYESVEPMQFTTSTLDLFCELHLIPSPDLIKIDTQGSELDVLKGGLNTFKNAKIVILETQILTRNTGAPRIQEVIDFMISNDFYPTAIVGINTIGHVIVQVDLAFTHSKLPESSRPI